MTFLLEMFGLGIAFTLIGLAAPKVTAFMEHQTAAMNDALNRELIKRGQQPPVKKQKPLHAALIAASGKMKPVTLKLEGDVVYIVSRPSGNLLTVVPLDAIRAVIHQDLSKPKKTMAGMAIVTEEGQYQFFCDGLLCPGRVKDMANSIVDGCLQFANREIDLVNPDEELIHRRLPSAFVA